MGFQEKNAWACLIVIGLVFTPYFYAVFRFPFAFVGLFVVAVIGLVIVLAGFHLVNAIFSRDVRERGDAPPKDELDRWIELRAAKIAGLVLGVVVISWCLVAMYGAPILGVLEIANAASEGAEQPPTQFALPISDMLLGVHALFAGFVIANLVYYGSIVVSYRRLTNG